MGVSWLLSRQHLCTYVSVGDLSRQLVRLLAWGSGRRLGDGLDGQAAQFGLSGARRTAHEQELVLSCAAHVVEGIEGEAEDVGRQALLGADLVLADNIVAGRPEVLMNVVLKRDVAVLRQGDEGVDGNDG
jgi:hypothetical protein